MNIFIKKSFLFILVFLCSACPKVITVPNVVNYPENIAMDELHSAGLYVISVLYMYSDDVPENRVISQDPIGGSKVNSNTNITLVISRGSDKVSVPYIIGVQQKNGIEMLHQYSLQVGTISRQFSDTYLFGYIISQEPKYGTKVVRGSKVNITLSLGKAPDPYGLRPITREKATQIAHYVRKTKIRSDDGTLVPIAWSMINQSCQDRSLLLQYLIASAPDPLPETERILEPNDLTENAIRQIVFQPYIDVASLNITGPLIVFQNLISTKDISFPDDPLHFYWPYHHAVVVNVEGNICVIDLSLQDAPIPIGEWTAKLTHETTCQEVSEKEYWTIWSYWLSLMSNWTPQENPETLCGYTITPMLTFRSDQSPQIQGVIDALPTLVVQTYAFQSLVMDTYGFELSFESIPFITSFYTPGTLDDLCSWVSFLFCQEE